MIISLKLRHWKSHEKTELSFGAGTNLIVGAMGSGKTSIMDAICFALYGTFPALRSRKVTLDEVVMLRPQKYDSAEVELRFQAGEQTYTVARVIAKGATEAFLRNSDSKLIEGPQSQRVTEAVENLLKVDYDLFTRSIYAEQNRIDYFLSLGKGERKKQIDELLGIDKFETARATAATVANRIKSLKTQSQGLLQGIDFEGMQRETESLKKELAALEQRASAAKQKLSATQAKLDAQKKLLSQLEEKERKARELEKEKAAAAASMNELLAEAERKKKSLSRPVARQELAQKGALQTELEAMRKAQKEAAELEKQLQHIEGEKAGIQAQLSELASLQGSAENAQKKAAQLSQELEKKRADAKQLSAKTASLKAEAASARREIAEAEKKSSLLRASIEKIGQALAALGGAQSIGEQQRASKERLAQLQKDIDHFSASAEAADSALHSLETEAAECPVCSAPLSRDRIVSLRSQKNEAKNSAAAQRDGFLKERASLEEKLRALQESSGDAKLLAERKAELAELESRGKSLLEGASRSETEAAELEVGSKGAEQETAALDNQLQTARALSEKLAQREKVSQKLSILSSQEQGLRSSLQSVAARFSEQRISAGEKNLEELRVSEEAFRAEDSAEAARKRLEKASADSAALAFDASQLSNARQLSSSLESEAASSRAESQSVSELSAEKRKQLDLNESRLSSLKQRNDEIGVLSSKVEEVGAFQSALVETQAELRQELVAAVNEAMSSLWQSIYPYGDYKSLKLESSEDDYSMQLQTVVGEWISIEEASGGEKSCASLAMRIAFAMVLTPNLSWLVLDEPTHNLDTQAVALLVRALHDEIPKIVKQTFIITHDEALKEGASAKVYRVERDKEKGDKSIVEELSV